MCDPQCKPCVKTSWQRGTGMGSGGLPINKTISTGVGGRTSRCRHATGGNGRVPGAFGHCLWDAGRLLWSMQASPSLLLPSACRGSGGLAQGAGRGAAVGEAAAALAPLLIQRDGLHQRRGELPVTEGGTPLGLKEALQPDDGLDIFLVLVEGSTEAGGQEPQLETPTITSRSGIWPPLSKMACGQSPPEPGHSSTVTQEPASAN